MKGILFFIIWCVYSSSHAQKRDETKLIRQAGTEVVSFEDARYFREGQIPFKDFIIIDERFDTTKLGYTNVDQKVKLKNGWSSTINNYFKNNLDSSSERSLVIFIKAFWMQRGIIEKVVHKKLVSRDFFSSSEFGDVGAVPLDKSGSVTCNLEIFSKTGDRYQALYRIDTFFLNPITIFRRNTLSQFFFLPFDSAFRKIAGADVNALLAKRKNLTIDEIKVPYQKRLSAAGLKDEIPPKGIYYSFKEFQQRRPNIATFRFEEGKLSDELYVVAGTTEQLISDYWGFSDGKSLYIKAGFSAFKAVRQEHTFEVYGSSYIANYRDGPGRPFIASPQDVASSLRGLNLSSTALERKIMQLNLDTGEFY